MQFWEIIMFVSKAKIKSLLIFFFQIQNGDSSTYLRWGVGGMAGADMGESSTSSRLNFKPKNVVEPVL